MVTIHLRVAGLLPLLPLLDDFVDKYEQFYNGRTREATPNQMFRFTYASDGESHGHKRGSANQLRGYQGQGRKIPCNKRRGALLRGERFPHDGIGPSH